MYCKLFASLYQGTLRGCSDEILVFTNLLAHCDAVGRVDKHFRAISEETGIPVERVKSAIQVLEAPDPESRSAEMEGARIARMDDHRIWGWTVVNYGKYRAIRNEDDRREQNRLAQERFRNKSKQRKPSSAQGEGEGEGEEPIVSVNGRKKAIKSSSYPEFIEILWSLFPSKSRERSSKKKISDQWKATGNKPDKNAIIEELKKWSSSYEWQKENGQFAPGAHLWIKDRKWESESPSTNKESAQNRGKWD